MKNGREKDRDQLRDSAATAEVLFGIAQSESAAISRGVDGLEQSTFAARLTVAVGTRLWEHHAKSVGCKWSVRNAPVPAVKGYSGLVDRLCTALTSLPADRAAYLLGGLYTSLLPDGQRKALGAYYTPPALAERLIGLITASGFEWSKGNIIDPACGGAAFLVPVARKLLKALGSRQPEQMLTNLEARLEGQDLDPTAAWLSMLLLDIEMLETTMLAGRPIQNLVRVGDALMERSFEKYDLIIGNPPYGKVTLSEEQRTSYNASLFGHANSYGLFTHLAVRLAKPGGIVAYVTPTSFLGGEYFKKLRALLAASAPMIRVDFVTAREGIFADVLQETMMVVFGKLPQPVRASVQVSSVECLPGEPARVELIGKTESPAPGGEPWLLPRREEHVSLVQKLSRMKQRLADYGFSVSTGQLVWNRHKEQLRASFSAGCYPIIWAEAVTPDGEFEFQSARRTHLPYLKVAAKQDWLLNSEPCILVQRTTAKEQKRRLIATLIPNSFLCEHPGYVVENHLNMVYSHSPQTKIALRTILALLNSSALDQAFRCINGSVAVSAYELNSLPLPDPEQILRLQKLVLGGASRAEIDEMIGSFYGFNQPGAAHRSSSIKADRAVAA